MDRERIQQIISLLKQSSSAELAVREGDVYVRVRRAPQTPPAAPQVTTAAPAAPHAATSVGAVPQDDAIIRARLVGRFYHGKGAGQPPLVTIGDRVEDDQIVATIEALGKIAGVPSTQSGDVIEFLCEDGKPVQYGDPLIRLRPA